MESLNEQPSTTKIYVQTSGGFGKMFIFINKMIGIDLNRVSIDMLRTSDSIFYFFKPDISKSKTCFEILEKKLSDGIFKPKKIILEVFLN